MTTPQSLQPPAPVPAPAPRAPAPRRARVPVDVAGKHGPIWGTLDVAGWLGLAGAIGVLTDTSAGWIPPLAFLGMLGALAVAHLRGHSAAALWVRVGCWTGGCFWLTWVLALRPRWQTAAVVVIGGALVAGTFTPIAARRRRKKAEAEQRAVDAKRQHQLDVIAADWTEHIRAKCPGAGSVKVVAVAPWDEGGGFDLDVDMNGVSWRKVQPYLDDLAAAANLPAGCGVSVKGGVDRGRAVVSVATVDKMADVRPMPEDYSALSVLNGLFIGWLRSGAAVLGDIRQASWLIIGRKGGGKTTLLNIIIAWLTRCTDCIVIIIDLNAGGLGVPWASAWMNGLAPRPAIEWLAGDAEEGRLVSRAMLAVALGRKRRAGRLKKLVNATLMPIGNGVARLIGGQTVSLPPEVVILVDESREIMGDRSKHRELANDLMQVEAIARDAGVNLVLAGLDGTSETISPFVKKQCAQRVCLPVADEAEIGYVLDWNSGAKTEDMPYPGTGLTRIDGAASPQPFRVPNMLPDQIERCSIAVAPLRPTFTTEDLQDIERELGAGVYEARWKRARRWFDMDGDSGDDDEGEQDQPAPEPTGPKGPDLSTAMGDMKAAADRAREVARQSQHTNQQTDGGQQDPPADDQSTALLNALWEMAPAVDPMDTAASPADTTLDDDESDAKGTDRRDIAAQKRMWQLLHAAGANGATPKQLADHLQEKDGFTTHRQTVHGWLNAEGAPCTKTVRGTYVWNGPAEGPSL